jgi:hypothetical protein
MFYFAYGAIVVEMVLFHFCCCDDCDHIILIEKMNDGFNRVVSMYEVSKIQNNKIMNTHCVLSLILADYSERTK